MKDIEILRIVKKVSQIARREKVTLTVQLRYNLDRIQVNITASDKLTNKGRYLLEKLLHMNTKAQRESFISDQLLRHGSRTDKEGNTFNLWLFNSAVCKIVGTRKEIRNVKKVIEPEKTIIVEEEVDVPIYKCPKGIVIKE